MTAEGPTTVLRGRVITVAPHGPPEARAVAIRAGKILSVSSGPGHEDAESEGDRTIDFGGRVIMPGFVDPHTHAEAASQAYAKVDCRAPSHASVADVLDELRDNLPRAEGSGWLIAQANLFFDQKLRDRRMPTLRELDSVSDRAAIAIQAGGHVTLLNSRAMELSHLERFEPGASGTSGTIVIERDSGGHPTGVVSEIDGLLPFPKPNRAELKAMIKRGVRDLYTRFGVTSIGEISYSLESLQCMDELVQAGDLAGRLAVYIRAPWTLSLEDACKWQDFLRFKSPIDVFHVKGVKMFADGGYSARNAATLTPYLAPYAVETGSRGQLSMDRHQLANATRLTRAAGLQLAVHANGERAQLEVAAGALEGGNGFASILPVRAEHAGNLLTDPATADAWRDAGLVPVSQPVFLYDFGDFIPVYLGEPGRHGQFPFRTLLAEGWHMCGSSDLALGSEERQSNPLFSMWCCVKRQSYLGELIEPEQRISVDDALRMHTLYAAEALGIGDRCGSIEVGKVADLIVLDRDPRAVEPDQLLDINVDFVFVGGQPVYERPAAVPTR